MRIAIIIELVIPVIMITTIIIYKMLNKKIDINISLVNEITFTNHREIMPIAQNNFFFFFNGKKLKLTAMESRTEGGKKRN